MQREAFHPAVPVALIELVARVGVPEETRALTHLRAQRVIEVPPPARPEPFQLASLPCQFGHQGRSAGQGSPRAGPRHLLAAPVAPASAHATAAATRTAATTMLR